MAKKNDADQLSLFGSQPLEASQKNAATLEVSAKTQQKDSALATEASGPVTQKRKRGRPPQKLVEQIRAQKKAGILIPNKMYFAISEVAEICDVKPYVLRYWESEFKLLRPSKNPSGQRMYQRKDIDMVFRIKKYLYDEGFTIAGAKMQLREDRRQEKAQGVHKTKAALAKIRGELSSLLTSVKK